MTTRRHGTCGSRCLRNGGQRKALVIDVSVVWQAAYFIRRLLRWQLRWWWWCSMGNVRTIGGNWGAGSSSRFIGGVAGQCCLLLRWCWLRWWWWWWWWCCCCCCCCCCRGDLRTGRRRQRRRRRLSMLQLLLRPRRGQMDAAVAAFVATRWGRLHPVVGLWWDRREMEACIVMIEQGSLALLAAEWRGRRLPRCPAKDVPVSWWLCCPRVMR